MVFSSSLVRVLTIFLLCFGFGAVAQAQSVDAAGAMSAAPAGTSITLPPGVQLPPNIQIPPGVTINQSGGGRAGATGSPSSPNNAQPSQPNAQSGQPSNPAAASRSNATNPSNSNNQNTDSSPKPSGSDLATSNTRVPNAFQNFLFQITGKSVGIYGMDLFNRTNPFAALESVPVPANYVLSPGDQISVKIYSPALDVDQGYTINKDGTIQVELGAVFGDVKVLGLAKATVRLAQ